MAAFRPWTVLTRAVRRLRGMLPFGARPEPPPADVDEIDDEAEDRLVPHDDDEDAGGGPWWATPAPRQRPANIDRLRRARDAPANEVRGPAAATARAVLGPPNRPPADRGGPPPLPRAERAAAPLRQPEPLEPPHVDPREAHFRRLEQILGRARHLRRWIAFDAPGAFHGRLEGVMRETNAVLDGEAALAFHARGGVAIQGLRIAALVRAVGLADAVELSRELDAAQILRHGDAPPAAHILARLAELELLTRA